MNKKKVILILRRCRTRVISNLIWIPNAWFEDRKWENSLPTDTDQDILQTI